MAELKSIVTPPVLGYSSHAAPMQLKFYRGTMFPASFQGDAFVTFRGSWNRSIPSGFEIARIRFDKSGNATSFEPFVLGFLQTGANGPSQSGRPVGLAVDKDGALLFTDDVNGALYRVSYSGPNRASAHLPPPAKRPVEMEARPRGSGLALARPETRSAATLRVASGTFAANGSIPMKASSYGDNQSPQLSWTALPAGATHIALLMEDPDAMAGHPFVHWVAWNIPASLGTLPESMPKDLQLADPRGMRQGRTTRGSIGYFGPRPPIGDRPHHYHIQLFALSGPLDVKLGASREELLTALSGKVLARGEIVGTFAQTAPPAKR